MTVTPIHDDPEKTQQDNALADIRQSLAHLKTAAEEQPE